MRGSHSRDCREYIQDSAFARAIAKNKKRTISEDTNGPNSLPCSHKRSGFPLFQHHTQVAEEIRGKVDFRFITAVPGR